MGNQLVQKWMDVVKPFDLESIKKQYAESYAKNLGLDPETSRQVSVAINSMDEMEMRELLRTFAEEVFSDDSLEAAIAFFESPAGQKYKEQRKLVMARSDALFGKYMADLVKKAFGM